MCKIMFGHFKVIIHYPSIQLLVIENSLKDSVYNTPKSPSLKRIQVIVILTAKGKPAN